MKSDVKSVHREGDVKRSIVIMNLEEIEAESRGEDIGMEEVELLSVK